MTPGLTKLSSILVPRDVAEGANVDGHNVRAPCGLLQNPDNVSGIVATALAGREPHNVTDHEIFELGDVVLQRGETLRGARLAYKTYGALNKEKSNAVVYPTRFGGGHTDNEWLIGAGMALDPSEYFVILPNMFGNGLSSSPSNTPPPYGKARFPRVTVHDNVQAQHRLVTERFGIKRLALVTGYSSPAHRC